MKVLIVAFHSRSMTPYSELYENVIKDNNDSYNIIFWDRFSNNKLEQKGNEFIIHKVCSLGGSKLKKRSEEHTSELQSQSKIAYAVF